MTDISIIIACLNGADTLAETLDSLVAQGSALSWDIVLADNGSTDASAAVFAAFATQHPHIPMQLVDASATRGKSHALNVGIRAAAGRSLLFCDADDTVAPGWLAAMSRALETHDFVAARFDIRALNPEWVLATRDSIQTTRLRRLPFEPFCPVAGGATLGFRRRVFEVVGGFDPAFAVSEDTDFCIRAHDAGFTLKLVQDAIYNYRLRATPRAIRRQAHTYASFDALLRRRCAAAQPFLSHKPWTMWSARTFRLLVEWIRHAVSLRQWDVAERAFFSKRLGTATGDFVGSLAFRVAPPVRAYSIRRSGAASGDEAALQQ